MHRTIASFAFALPLLALSPEPAAAQSANHCIKIDSKKLGYSRPMHVIRNACNYDVVLMWCVRNYVEVTSGKSAAYNREHDRNCGPVDGHYGRKSWNPRLYWYHRGTLRAGKSARTYGASNSGKVEYAACRARVNGEVVSIRGSASSNTSFRCVL